MKARLSLLIGFVLIPFLLLAQGMILNEMSNGNAGAREFMEFVVIGSAANPTGAVDLSGWIIDDNNGDFENLGAGTGIASGHLRFAPGCFTSVKPGSIILIYNAAEVNTNITLTEDPTDVNGDCIYVVSSTSTCLQRCNTLPSTSNRNYTPCTMTTPANWSHLGLANTGDAGQVRRPNGSFYHGFAYGLSAPFPTFPSDFGGGSSFSVAGAGTGGTFIFNSGSFTRSTNFTRRAAGTTEETPGYPNNDANRYFINAVRSGTYDYSNLNNPLNTGTMTSVLNCNLLLPIKLAKFEAERAGKLVNLTWQVASSTSPFFGFEVERSQDAIHFYSIGKLEGDMGTEFYSFIDGQAFQNNYYRLKMIDEDGAYQYSAIRFVAFETSTTSLSVYPNPVKNFATIQFSAALETTSTIQVVDMFGKVVDQFQIPLGTQVFQLETEKLANGAYLIRILEGVTAYTKGFIKQ